MQYKVRWFDAVAGVLREEIAQADSAQALASRYSGGGSMLLSAEAQTPGRRAAGHKALDVAWWCRELRTLLSAGMTVVETLETLHAQPLGQVHAELVRQLREGRTLSDAMESCKAFPDVLVAGVRASERTSGLVESLDDFLKYHDVLERLRKQVVSAAIYPTVVIVLGAAIAVFLLLFVIPRFSRMYGDLHASMSWTTQVMVSLSRAMAQQGPWLAAAISGLLAMVVLAWRRGLVAAAFGWLCEAIPSVRRQLDEFRLAKLYQSLTLMFRGGYALNDALSHCAGLGLGQRLAQGVERTRLALARGERVSTAFIEAGLTDAVTRRLLAVGERTGNFDRVLQTIAERHAANFTTFIERTTRIVEPLMLLAVALVVGGIVVAMYMPVFDVAGSLR
jgi:general secretion pathway protein F